MRNMALLTNVILTVVETGYICGGTDIVLQDYAAVQKQIVLKKGTINMLQSDFVDNAFGPTKYSEFSAVLVQGESWLYWFAQTFLHFLCTPTWTGFRKSRICVC